jgi:hypothetical protein
MRDLHYVNGWTLIVANAAVGVWCLAAYRWPRLGGAPMWGAVIVAQLLAFSQAVTGAVWSRREGVVLNDMHALYGFSAIVAVAIMYSYRNSGFLKGREALLYGFGSLFVMGLGLRNLVL